MTKTEEKKRFNENLIKLTGSSNNYEMYEINNDNFTRLRRLIRIRQISFSKVYARAMVIAYDNVRLRNLFKKSINEKQKNLYAKQKIIFKIGYGFFSSFF